MVADSTISSFYATLQLVLLNHYTGDEPVTFNSARGNVALVNLFSLNHLYTVCECVFCQIVFPAQGPQKFRKACLEMLNRMLSAYENMVQ